MGNKQARTQTTLSMTVSNGRQNTPLERRLEVKSKCVFSMQSLGNYDAYLPARSKTLTTLTWPPKLAQSSGETPPSSFACVLAPLSSSNWQKFKHNEHQNNPVRFLLLRSSYPILKQHNTTFSCPLYLQAQDPCRIPEVWNIIRQQFKSSKNIKQDVLQEYIDILHKYNWTFGIILSDLMRSFFTLTADIFPSLAAWINKKFASLQDPSFVHWTTWRDLDHEHAFNIKYSCHKPWDEGNQTQHAFQTLVNLDHWQNWVRYSWKHTLHNTYLGNFGTWHPPPTRITSLHQKVPIINGRKTSSYTPHRIKHWWQSAWCALDSDGKYKSTYIIIAVWFEEPSQKLDVSDFKHPSDIFVQYK